MSVLIFKDLKCDINKNIVWLLERQKPRPKPNSIILINLPEHAGQTPRAWGFNCEYSPDNYR